MKYIPRLHATKLDDGGYILHGSNDVGKDIELYKTSAGRIGPIITYMVDKGFTSLYEPYKYYNWLGLHFPLLHIQVVPVYPMDFDDCDDNTKHIAVLAEKHLLIDRIFESYLTSVGYMPNEWDALPQSKKDQLIGTFKALTNFYKY